MNDLNSSDSTSDLNSKLTESLVIMDNVNKSDSLKEKKVRKSITLNLEVQPSTSARNSLNSNEIPKGIFKKSNDIVHIETGRDYEKLQEQNLDLEDRPHNLEELIKADDLSATTMESEFYLDDLDENSEIFLMEIPKTVNPELLKGQILSFTDKSKFKIGENRYIATPHEAQENLSFVFSTKNESESSKIVNIKPAGIICMRKKISSVPKPIFECSKESNIPLRQNIRRRDPFHGVVGNETRPNVKIKEEFRKKW